MRASVHRGNWMITVPLAAGAVAYVMLLYLPSKRAIAEIQEQIEEKQDYIDRAIGVATSLSAAQQELARAKAYTEAWKQHAPKQKELPAVFAKINEFAKTSGVTISRFDPAPTATNAALAEVSLTLACAGSFAQVGEFLRNLEAMPAGIWIRSCNLAKAPAPREDIWCEVNLVIFSDISNSSDYVNKFN